MTNVKRAMDTSVFDAYIRIRLEENLVKEKEPNTYTLVA